MVQAVACRAALYGFNSHPQLHGQTHILLTYFRFLKSFRLSISQTY